MWWVCLRIRRVSFPPEAEDLLTVFAKRRLDTGPFGYLRCCDRSPRSYGIAAVLFNVRPRVIRCNPDFERTHPAPNARKHDFLYVNSVKNALEIYLCYDQWDAPGRGNLGMWWVWLRHVLFSFKLQGSVGRLCAKETYDMLLARRLLHSALIVESKSNPIVNE